MEYKIEKGIPVPAPRNEYPFRVMEVGDSFAVPSTESRRVRSAANNFGMRNGRKFTVKNLPNKVRVWRIK